MKREYAKAAGYAALLLLLFTGIAYAVRNAADWGLWAPLGLGLAAAGFWLSEFRHEAAQVLASRQARQGANSVVYTLAVIAIVVLVQALIVNNDVSADLTKDKSFTLADETVKAVKGLEQKVQVLAFFGPESRGAFEDTLKRVKKVNPAKFDYEFVNMTQKPLVAESYGIRAQGSSVVVVGDKKETFNGTREEDLLNALLKVSSGAKKQVYFLSGHQEANLDDAQPMGASGLKQGLESSSFITRTLNLASAAKAEIPPDAAAVVVAGPRTDLMAPELDALSAYLARGGRVLVAVDIRTRVPALRAWLAKSGVTVDEDIVIDANPFNQIFGGSAVAPVIQSFDPSHPITRDLLQQQGQAIFPKTRSLALGKLPDGANAVVLARTLPTAFGWMGQGDNAPLKPGAGDRKGPLELMVAVDLPAKGRLVVLGTSVLFNNQGVRSFNNQDLTINSLRWLADEEKRIALAPKSRENTPLLLDRARLSLMWWTVVLLSLGALVAGGAVALARRRAVA